MAVITEPRIDLVQHACVAPLTLMHRPKGAGSIGTFDGGIYYNDGSVCETSLQIKNLYRNVPPPLDVDIERLPCLPGRHIFGGLLHEWHFGHFVTESISRLWAINELPSDYDSLVFYNRHLGMPVPRYAKQMIAALGWRGAITVVTEPMRVDHIAVPTQLAEARLGYAYGHPLVRRFMGGIASYRKDLPRKLYVSRSGLKPDDGLLVGERFIEDNLRAEGYTVVHPQEIPVAEQLDLYRSADDLVFSEGSPIHLYAYVSRPEQRAFVVWRRKPIPIFNWQIRSFGARAAKGKPHIRGMWVPRGLGDATQRAKAVLNFDGLRDDLVGEGMICGSNWRSPSLEMLEAAASDLLERSRFEYDYKSNSGKGA